MTIGTVRRLAADLMNVGQNKIRINPDGLKEAEGALTRIDVKGLIDKGVITKQKPQGRASTARKKRRGRGRRKGTPLYAKGVWMAKVRSQRKLLRLLIESGTLKEDSKREIYGKVKSGIFRNKRAMLTYLKENKLVAVDYEPPKEPRWTQSDQAPKAQHKQEAPAAGAKPAQAQAPAQRTAPAPVHNVPERKAEHQRHDAQAQKPPTKPEQHVKKGGEAR
jgi:large subunit ribosomal protein L19e